MVPVVFSESGTNVVLTWAEPSSLNGAAISAYRIKLLHQNSGLYFENSTLCNGSNPAVKTCSIPMTQFTSTL